MTQIQDLINGAKNVIRDLSAPKYSDAAPATSHVGYAGTPQDIRTARGAAVLAENGDTLHITARGLSLDLHIGRSVSGKSWWYSTDLTQDQYIALGGQFTAGTLKRYSMVISQDMTVTLNSFTRKSELAQWKLSHYDALDESLIVIG